ncbi:hypothetical protein M011DRAFT_478812 [Sporormia fimetaria CBS 119925]|uniref:KOW domain-containing protein n=1 Tax=Sporormia fimetaria CBS 119925 TaxID=1340428 RepID=A0A6A6V932_9PLEO|nr:hypothetical protein M011DRAFT_478812 [Sporormia fimetaria CBS 119925]
MGRNAVKYARELKAIRKVKAAIRFRDREYKKLQASRKERLSVQQVIAARQAANRGRLDNVRASLRNANEDWRLGPLRPNRAVIQKDDYGLLGHEITQSELDSVWDLPEKVKKHLYPWVAPEGLAKMWSVAKGDRVAVIRGPHKGKIGTVSGTMENRAMLFVTGIGKTLVQGRTFGYEGVPQMEREPSIAIDDVRLVVAMPKTVLNKDGTPVLDNAGNPVVVPEDVLIEKVRVEKHTSGLNPFTGKHEQNIPEDQQVDPLTDVPILHRYIAGTDIAIPWPWEKSESERQDDTAQTVREHEEAARNRTLLQKLNPTNWKLFNKSKEDTELAKDENDDNKLLDPNGDFIPNYDPKEMITSRPLETEPRSNNDDTTRNHVFGETKNFTPTLSRPPFPATVVEELGGRLEYSKKAARERKEEAKRIEEERKEKLRSMMKTPLQVRWEMQQQLKERFEPGSVRVPGELLERIGGYMAKKGVKTAPAVGKKEKREKRERRERNVEIVVE